MTNIKITPILDKLLEYKSSWIQHVKRMPRNRLPRVMKHFSPTGRRNQGRPLKRLLDTWDRNGSTSGPTPWHIWWWWDWNKMEHFPGQQPVSEHFHCKMSVWPNHLFLLFTSTLKMEAIRPIDTLLSTYKPSQYHDSHISQLQETKNLYNPSVLSF